MKKKTLLTTLLAGAMILSLFGCDKTSSNDSDSNKDILDMITQESTKDEETSDNETSDDKLDIDLGDDEEDTKVENGSVYYLNYKPDQDNTWKALAKAYTDETGIEVKVLTAANGTYNATLKAELTRDNQPTLFQVNGPVELAEFRDYCADLSNTDVCKELTSNAYTLTDDGKVYAIGYTLETYGIIVNKTLLAKAGYKVEDINSFADLKKIAEDITARSNELGFSAFTSAGMDSSSDWRFKTHLANLPIYFEYQKEGISYSTTLKGTFLNNYRDIFDLYINNSTCSSKDLDIKTGDDARNEFLAGEAVFYQNGSWEYYSLSNVFSDNELVMIPIYTGAGDESKQGLCTGTENYWCVNSQVSEADQKATLDFLYWCVTSETGTMAMAYDMGFVIPFKKATETYNLFIKQDMAYTAAGKTPVTWNFTTMPSELWKQMVGEALMAYAADPTDANWDAVVKAFVGTWAEEWEYNSK